jgi:predicted alpha/beta hydrolase family esterase
MRSEYLPEKIRNNVKDWKVFLSEDDPYILFPLAKKHFDSVGVNHIEVSKSGHFVTSDGYTEFDALLEAIIPSIRVYTTRVDTVYGMTYAVLAPDHPSV